METGAGGSKKVLYVGGKLLFDLNLISTFNHVKGWLKKLIRKFFKQHLYLLVTLLRLVMIILIMKVFMVYLGEHAN